MLDVTSYGKLTRSELVSELADVTNTLQSRLREYGATTEDYNSQFYAAYIRVPGNSVAAKERDANYDCLPVVNELALLDAEIKALTTIRDCITTILPYAAE